MTQLTIAFDEKFDLENGELKVSIIDDIETDSLGWNDDYLTEYFDINNAGNVTQITYNDSYENGQYWQFGYFVDNELIKATKYIPIGELSQNYTSGQSINIADVEKLVFILSDNDTMGVQDSYDEEDNYIENAKDLLIEVSDITQLPEYDDISDYDLSNMLVGMYSFWDDELEGTFRIGDLINVGNDYYRLNEDIGSTCIRFISPGVVSNRAELSESS